MPQCTIDHLKSSLSSFCSAIGGLPEPNLEIIESKLEQLISEFNYDAITYCLEKYIGAELDYKTPGSRGLGRMTTITPRFGAYFRKPLSKLSSKELNELYFLIQDLCLKGYSMSAIFAEWPARNAKLSDGVLLFEKWIPCIYVINPCELDPRLWDIIETHATITIMKIHVFMGQHGKKSDTLFNRVGRLLSGDKVNEILLCYASAGYSLRAVEEGWY